MKQIFIVLVVTLSLIFSFEAQSRSHVKHHKRHHIENVHKGTTSINKATYYGNNYKGRRHTANGEVFNMNAMTCASNSHPFGTMLKVTNVKNGKSVVVRVTDRGGFPKGYIDLTYGAFQHIAEHKAGVIKVEVEVVS